MPADRHLADRHPVPANRHPAPAAVAVSVAARRHRRENGTGFALGIHAAPDEEEPAGVAHRQEDRREQF